MIPSKQNKTKGSLKNHQCRPTQFLKLTGGKNVNNNHELLTTSFFDAQQSSFNQRSEDIAAGFQQVIELLRSVVNNKDNKCTRKLRHDAISFSESGVHSCLDSDHGETRVT